MRIWGKTVILFAGLVAIASMAPAQQPFPFGGGFGGQQADPVLLLRNAAVKKELNLTDEQAEKIPAAVMKALGEVLKPDQLKRLRQIELQQRGSNAFKDAEVQTVLKLSGDQKENINNILEESQKGMAELRKEIAAGNFQGVGEKMTALRKETSDKLLDVLTADQKKNWTAMLGDEFKMPAPKGDFFKGKKKKKDDQ